jgi:PAS domain S-box-containing protein
MTRKDKRPDQTNELQRSPKKIVRKKTLKPLQKKETLTPEETRCLIHNVGAHQLELAIQNKELHRAHEALKYSLSLLSAALESTADGLLIVNRDGKVARYNQKFAEMWKIPQDVLAGNDDDVLLDYVMTQLADPGQFLAKVREMYGQPEQSSFDRIDFMDGRVFERYSQPQKIENTVVGRVWSFRDITEHKRSNEALQKALDDIKILRGLIPICANCKDIRDDQGSWSQVEVYIRNNSEAKFSHGICPKCMKILYPEVKYNDGSEPKNDEGA